MIHQIKTALDNFALDLHGKSVLTEAATGNFVVTPIIAALAGANVFAFTKSTRYGSVADVRTETAALARRANIEDKIHVVDNLSAVPLAQIDIVTNTGHLRPIDAALISQLSPRCVIPLMWEPWEYRKADLDLAGCRAKGIKVYGTDEEDQRLRTKDYLGYLLLSLLLQHRLTPFSANILLVGSDKFVLPVSTVLGNNNYSFTVLSDYDHDETVSIDSINTIVLLEHERDRLLIDADGLLLGQHRINKEALVVHLCGNVVFPNQSISFYPSTVRPFGYMSLTPDQVDPKCVIDLHAAGLKVAEGMLTANKLGLTGIAYKHYLEQNYPALAFDDERYW